MVRWDLEPNLQFYFNPGSGVIAAEVGDIYAISRGDEERWAQQLQARQERGELVEPFTGACTRASGEADERAHASLNGRLRVANREARQALQVAREEISGLMDRPISKAPLPV
jgi:hypothetical protein